MARIFVMLAALLLGVSTLAAQQPELSPVPQDTGRSVGPARAQLEARLRERVGQVVRNRLQLTDTQFDQLATVNQKYDGRRRALLQQERGLRVSLRGELLRDNQADQRHVDDLMDQLVSVQQNRLELFREEQRDLARFLTPVQRAKYAALQEQIRQRTNELRRQQLERRRPAAPLTPQERRMLRRQRQNGVGPFSP